MTMLTRMLIAAAVVGLAAPAAAQYYPQPSYPQQQYPGYPGQYPNQYPYGYQNNGGAIGQIIDQLLGNRYSVSDRTAVSQCASAAMVQAQAQYRGYGQQGYGYGQQGYGQQGYGYGQQGYNRGYAAPAMRVTAITDVQRRSNGLRVKGLINSGYYGGYGGYSGQYGNQYGYQNQAYATGDLTFRCNVDYRGVVTDVRIGRNDSYRRY